VLLYFNNRLLECSEVCFP